MAVRLAIRVDADSTIGAGHVMRCLALAQGWRRAGGEVAFLFAGDPPSLRERLEAERMEIKSLPCQRGGAEDAAQTVAYCQAAGVEWVAVDGYQFDAKYYETLKQSGSRVLVIDDYAHARQYLVDVVLNQNVYAVPSLYPLRGDETELLLGADYLLLREEFIKWRAWERRHPAVARRILVTLGGGDSTTALLQVVESLAKLERADLEVKLLCGHLNRNHGLLVSAAGNVPFLLEVVTSSDEMPNLMAWADIGISAGGSTCWEMAFMGLPALAIVLADNQRPVVHELARQGTVVGLGLPGERTTDDLAAEVRRLLSDHDRRVAMSHRGRELVDGQGADRVVTKLRAALSVPMSRN